MLKCTGDKRGKKCLILVTGGGKEARFRKASGSGISKTVMYNMIAGGKVITMCKEKSEIDGDQTQMRTRVYIARV